MIVEAHFAEYLTREKRLKPVDHYLKPRGASVRGDVASNTVVAAGLKQMEKRGLAVTVKRIAPPKAGPQPKD